MESITLPYAATIKEIDNLQTDIKKAISIDRHDYLRLWIDRGGMVSFDPFAPGKTPSYKITRVKLWAVSPFNYHKKARFINAPIDKDFVVSIASLKKKIAELEAWHQSELELKAQKDQKAKEQKNFAAKCEDLGLPMNPYTVDGTHYFQVAIGGVEDLSITINRRFNQEQAIALDKFLKELFKENDCEQ